MNTFTIIGLTAIALVSIIPMVKPVPPTLTAQFFSRPVVVLSWTANAFGPSCFNGTLNALNFTENLASRDPGSTWITFRGQNNGFLVKSTDDAAFLCPKGVSSNSYENLILARLTSYTTWRVLTSGTYTVFNIAPQTPFLINETWTITRIT